MALIIIASLIYILAGDSFKNKVIAFATKHRLFAVIILSLAIVLTFVNLFSSVFFTFIGLLQNIIPIIVAAMVFFVIYQIGKHVLN